jgi:hypothetical protein
MSWQDVQSYYVHRDDNDDGPPPKTIPEKPRPGERFMQKAPYSWDVIGWETEACDCYDGREAKKDCPMCKGTGEGNLIPVRIAADLSEGDARLLAFGEHLVCLAEEAVLRVQQAPNNLAVELTKALAEVRGDRCPEN